MVKSHGASILDIVSGFRSAYPNASWALPVGHIKWDDKQIFGVADPALLSARPIFD
jgi:hypothetical protein